MENLTESEAWKLISTSEIKKSLRNKIVFPFELEISIKGVLRHSYGLCSLIWYLYESNYINNKTLVDMESRLVNIPYVNYGYRWYCNEEGHKKRLDFAKHMSESTKEQDVKS